MSRPTLAAIFLSLTALTSGLLLGRSHGAYPETWKRLECPDVGWARQDGMRRCQEMVATLMRLKREDLRGEWAHQP